MRLLRLILCTLSVVSFQALDIEAQTDATSDDMNFAAFGEKINPDNAKKVTEVTKSMLSMDSTFAKIKGLVEEVCQVKGCWMTVTDAAPEDSAPLFVKFKDYGFFVPKDLAGKEVIMEGMAYREITSVEELQHYAKDAGKSESEINLITEPREELRFLANGVLVKN